MTVTETIVQVFDGVESEATATHTIQASQLAAHLAMFADDMSDDQLETAQAIIAAQGGE